MLYKYIITFFKQKVNLFNYAIFAILNKNNPHIGRNSILPKQHINLTFSQFKIFLVFMLTKQL